MRHVLRGNLKRNVILYEFPWHKYLYELAQSNETIGQKTKAANQGKHHGDVVRGLDPPTLEAKACSQPFGTCIGIGAPEPFGQEHHIEHLVKHRP